MAASMSRTINAGSDDASIVYCEVCGNVPADAYCSDCPEFLCAACANLHERQRISRHHRLLRGAAMPSTHLTSAKQVSDTARFQKCPKHPEKDLEFFCDTHDLQCCVACTVLLHNQFNQCTVAYIPEVAKEYKTGPEYVQLTADLKQSKQLAAKCSTDIEKKMKAVEQLMFEESTKLETYQTELKEFVDKRINELKSQVKQLGEKDMDSLKKQHTKSKSMEDNIDIKMMKLQTREETPCELFTESKHIRNEVEQLQEDIADIASKTKYQLYSVHKDDQMEAVLKNKDGLATVEIATISPGSLSRQRDLVVTSSGEGDIVIPYIAVLSTSRLLVSDHWNYTLRLVDSVNGGVLSQVSLPDGPRGVCHLGNGEAAAALPNVCKIQFVRINSDKLSLDRSIDVKGNPVNISVFDSSHLVVTYQGPGMVEMMTIDGRVTDMVDKQKAGKQLFQYPNYIAISNRGDIYVSDWFTRTITQMDRTLRITRTFTSPVLTSPRGIVSVSTDQLLVADEDSHSIVVLNPTSGTVTPLLGQADGIQKPWAVAWCPVSKKLFVGRYERHSAVSVFCLK